MKGGVSGDVYDTGGGENFCSKINNYSDSIITIIIIIIITTTGNLVQIFRTILITVSQKILGLNTAKDRRG